jgi:hypothetical protein
MQSTMLTGTLPREHGIVANGWYFRDLAEVWLWRQSNRLVRGEKVWDAARAASDPPSPAPSCSGGTTCTRRRLSVTPRPMYLADGRKLPTSTPTRPACATNCSSEAGPVPAVQLLGARGGHRVEPLDRRQRAARSSSSSGRR